MMREAKRDVAPPGWFRRLRTEIASFLNFLCALIYIGFGSVVLFAVVVTMLRDGFNEEAVAPYLMFLVIGGWPILMGFSFLRQWRRGEAGR